MRYFDAVPDDDKEVNDAITNTSTSEETSEIIHHNDDEEMFLGTITRLFGFVAEIFKTTCIT